MGFTWYSGPSSNFPGMNQWKSFEEIFNANKSEMFATGNAGEDIGRIWNAVVECAKLGVEERVIFCIIMQVSSGRDGGGRRKGPVLTRSSIQGEHRQRRCPDDLERRRPLDCRPDAVRW